MIINLVGTDTDVGKTVASAALAAALQAEGLSLAVYKPVQTGVGPGMPGDADVIAHLSGATCFEGVRLSLPMAPVAAARAEGSSLPSLGEHRDRVRELAGRFDAVLVEGSGGLTVDLAPPLRSQAGSYRPQNQADLISLLASELPGVLTVIVARSGLGTLNHISLTYDYLQRRNIGCLGVVIGAWPQEPTYLEEANLLDIAERGLPVLGRIPAGVGGNLVVGQVEQLEAGTGPSRRLSAQAGDWLSPLLQRLPLGPEVITDGK